MIFQDFSESFPDAVVKTVQGDPQPDTTKEPDTTPTEASYLIPAYTFEDFASTDKPYAWLYDQRENPFLQQQLIQKLNVQAKKVGYNAFLGTWKKYQEQREPKQQLLGDFVTMFPEQPVQLHCGKYVADEFGVGYTGRKGEGIEVCSHPIMPVKRLVNVDTGVEHIEIAFSRGRKDGKPVWKCYVFPKETICSSQKIVSLSAFGYAITSENAKEVVKFLSEVESLNYDELPEVASISHLGWHGNQFFPYTGNLIYDGQSPQHKKIINSLVMAGDREKWLTLVANVRAGNNIEPRIILACSFASVLVYPTGKLPFLVQLISEISGIGKTVAMMLAASVWGNPGREAGLIQIVNGTDAGLEFKNNFLRDLPCFLDETQTVENSKKGLGEFVYKFAEGIGKTRGNKNGDIRNQCEWHNCVISSGERSIVSNGDHAGVYNRVIEIYARNTLFDSPRDVANIITQNYGFAGQEFIRELQNPNNKERLRNIIKVFCTELEDNYHITPKQADTGSLILAADTLATEFIFHDDNALTAAELAHYLKTNTQIDMNRRLYESICDWLIQNQSNFITLDSIQQPPSNLWGKIEEIHGVTHWYIIPRILRSEIENNLSGSFKAFCKWCESKNVIISHKSDKDNHRDKNIWLKNSYARCIDFIRDYDPDEEEQQATSISQEQEQEQDQAQDYTGFTKIDYDDLPF